MGGLKIPRQIFYPSLRFRNLKMLILTVAERTYCPTKIYAPLQEHRAVARKPPHNHPCFKMSHVTYFQQWNVDRNEKLNFDKNLLLCSLSLLSCLLAKSEGLQDLRRWQNPKRKGAWVAGKPSEKAAGHPHWMVVYTKNKPPCLQALSVEIPAIAALITAMAAKRNT